MSLVARLISLGLFGSLIMFASVPASAASAHGTTPARPTWETASEEEGTFWQRLSSSARGFFARTKEVLLPHRDPRPEPVRYKAPSRGLGFGFGRRSAQPIERDAPATMKEWMDLERPGD
ncbi:MAG: hypothetical protein AB7U73_06565 [Pirellulales bacterium]